jgi:general transcription factor 3C polypeptide 5 (transcription factor C subunit 1)
MAYRYLQNPNLSIEDGKLINSAARKTRVAIQKLDLSASTVPMAPIESANNYQKSRVEKILPKIVELFEQRPIWTRAALIYHSRPAETGPIITQALVTIAYFCEKGAWRNCWIKFGIDPRSDIKYRFMQSIYIKGTKKKGESSGDDDDSLYYLFTLEL